MHGVPVFMVSFEVVKFPLLKCFWSCVLVYKCDVTATNIKTMNSIYTNMVSFAIYDLYLLVYINLDLPFLSCVYLSYFVFSP